MLEVLAVRQADYTCTSGTTCRFILGPDNYRVSATDKILVMDTCGSLVFVFLSGTLQGWHLGGLLTLVYNDFLNHIRLELGCRGRGSPRGGGVARGGARP